ncbi:protein SENSITIVE TO PROTON RHIZOTOXICITY 2-like [Camellia sinensis]|uniref:protein SENSITIVE TO PROTON RHIZOTOXICITY 2-like n=1 Tax=Camellia sinensis TaxID=4442 RepID=UPI00103663D5|nr:protein SENSITIVE TO PROTON RHIZOTOXICITY 2-like [Camellia sinensis]
MDAMIISEEKSVMTLKVEDEKMKDEIGSDDWEIIELDVVKLLAEHIHSYDICRKGFKRVASLWMHMRAHGNRFKTREAVAKPERCSSEFSRRKTRFFCPFVGCNRNKSHKKFRLLKSVICVKNHFKRSHCPKMYSCNCCNKKSFSVLVDLKSHLKNCGESKWKCSCGNEV